MERFLVQRFLNSHLPATTIETAWEQVKVAFPFISINHNQNFPESLIISIGFISSYPRRPYHTPHQFKIFKRVNARIVNSRGNALDAEAVFQQPKLFEGFSLFEH